jgi:hypothetical protein
MSQDDQSCIFSDFRVIKGEQRGFSSPVRGYNVVVVSLEVCH